MSERQPVLHRIGQAAASVGSQAPRRRLLRLGLQGGIAIVILGFLVVTVIGQWSEIVDAGIHFNAIWLLPAFLLMPFYFALNAAGWNLILRMMGHGIGVMRAQVAWGQPLLARYVPGSVLYVLARVLLTERAGVPRRITLASIFYEQALSVSGAVAVSTWFFISHPDLQGEPWRFAVLGIVPMLLTLLHPRIFGPLANRTLAAFGREPLPATVPFKGVVAMLAYYAANWAVMGFSVYFVTRSVVFVPFDQVAVVGSAQAIGYVAAVATLVAPAGLGVRDAAFAWTVKAALPSRSFAIGSLVALAVRGVITVVELVYVGLVTVLARRLKFGWGMSQRYATDQLEGGEAEDERDQNPIAGERRER